MKITRLDVSGFRAFSEQETFDLDADIVLLTGANGRGKTSVLDAILWCITGELPRLRLKDKEKAPVVSLYSSTRQARVELHLSDGEKRARLTRSRSGDGERISVQTSDDKHKGQDAEHWVTRNLWKQAQSAEQTTVALSRALTRSVYLQQDLVREFVEADTAKERFTAVSELVGTARMDEMSDALDVQRKQWRKVSNNLANDIKKAENELASLKGERSRLDSPEDEDRTDLEATWKAWWERAATLGVEREAPDVAASEAALAAEEAVKTLATLRRKAERRREEADDLRANIQKREGNETSLPNLPALEEALAEARSEKENADQQLEEARRNARTQRERLLQQQEREEELRTLAELALRHIEGACPVCEQDHVTEETRRLLEERIEGETDDLAAETSREAEESNEAVQQALQVTGEREEAVAEAQRALETARTRHREAEREQESIQRRLEELDVTVSPDESTADALQRYMKACDERIDALEQHHNDGERLSMRLATVAQEARRKELIEQIEAKEQEIAKSQGEREARDETSDLADVLVEELEQARLDFVEERLDNVSALLQAIYAKIDPHPTFRLVRLAAEFSHRRGRLRPFVADPEHERLDPFKFMSSSQVNVVALSIFMALNLGIPSVPLKTLMLDDPLQSLDDINLLGLVDLIRQARGRRQIFLSTHEQRLAKLLRRKLRPVDEEHRTMIFEFRDWSREGPDIDTTDMERERKPLRLVAA